MSCIMDGRLWASVDASSSSTGIAWWIGLELLRTEAVCRRKRGVELLNLWTAYHDLADATLVVIEDGYVGINARSGLVLAEERGAIKAIAQSGGADVVVLPSSTWRPKVLTSWRANMNRKQSKTLARAAARWLSTPRVPTGSVWDSVLIPDLSSRSEDEIEAVLLGLAWSRKMA